MTKLIIIWIYKIVVFNKNGYQEEYKLLEATDDL